MSTSTAEHDSYLVENWDTETLIDFLKEQNLKLDDDDLGILRKEKIDGPSFLDMTEEKFMQAGLKMGPAMKLAKEVQALKEKPKRAFSSYLSLNEVLAKYGLDSDGIDSIPLFSPPTYEIQDDNKVFKRCMEEILGRLRSYGTLQPDSLEAMRNEYVVALLHASIHIVMDITNKDLSMKPQYGIVGEESRGRVDYAIKEAEELICITEDKQHKVPIGFAQNIKQLESACETNKKKRKRGDNDFDYLYGIVTTGRDWHFLLYSPGKISKASDTANLIEFSRKALEPNSKSYQSLCDSVKEVLGIIVGLLMDRACAEEERTFEYFISSIRILSIMSSELELLRQRITDLEAENAKLRQIIEENAKRDAENGEHKVRIEELEKNSADISTENAELKAELAKLRHDFEELKTRSYASSSNLTRPQQPQHVTNVQNSCSVEEDISSAKPERRFASNDIPDLVIDQRVADNADIESMDTFLDETFKKSVSDGFRQRNREKKLLHESATQDLSGVSNETTSSVIKDEKSQSHKKREAENIVQDVFDFTATSAPEKNHMTEISMTARHEKSDMDNPPNILQNLACLIQEAWDAKDEAILANQKELLCWCSYIVEFNKKTTEFMTEYKIGEKKAKGMIYDNLIKLLRPGTKRNTLLKQTQRARDIYKLFEKIGIDKIKYITTYSANSISELSDSQIQTIVDYFSKNPNTELPDDRDGTIIDFEEDISNDQDNVLEEQAKPLVSATRAEVSIPTAPIPLTHVSNSSGDSSSSKKLDAKVKVVPPIPQPETLVHDRSYFRNKTLDQYLY